MPEFAQIFEFRIFLSSPGDVPQERDDAEAVVAEINDSGEFDRYWRLKLFRWDDKSVVLPMPATEKPQKSVDLYMTRPSQCDLLVCIFWTRMGTPLVMDDQAYQSGTHYEFSEGMDGFNTHGKPAVWVYRCTEDMLISQRDPKRDEKNHQFDLVEKFFAGFKNADGHYLNGLNEYPTHDAFKALFKSQLLTYLRHLRDSPRQAQAKGEEKDVIAPALPAKTYRRLIGRKQQIDRITSNLLAADSLPIITIIGQGGMGKTTLAREAIERCMKKFDYILWASGQTERLSGNRVQSANSDIQDFDSLLDILGEQLQIKDIVRFGLNEKRFKIQDKLEKNRVLIVLDNMETVSNAESLIDNLFQIHGQSKILVTSRFREKHEQAFVINLDKMLKDEGLEFIRAYVEETNNAALEHESDATFEEIYTVTGGQPLAMKLVVSMISERPKQVVLAMVQEVQSELSDFYTYLYFKSWGMLTESAENLLVDMTVIPAGTQMPYEALQELSTVDASQFDGALTQLVRLSLTDKSGGAADPQYSLHPLVHHFVKSKITEEIDE